MNAIEISGLEKRYGALRALKDLSVSIPHGLITWIAGPNGAGKSTLLRVLGALTRPSRGSVRILGLDPFGPEGPAARGRVGYLGSETSLYGELTVRENLEFWARVQGIDPARIDPQLSALNLERVAQRRVRTLSLGYRRRAGLARAQLGDPPLLLLDEPWNGLDTEASRRLRELLEQHRRAGHSVLVAAHTPDLGTSLFDAALHLEGGRLVSFEREMGT